MSEQINPFGDPVHKYGATAIASAVLESLEDASLHGVVVRQKFTEFTCLCPRSGYPDFASIYITYRVDSKIVELKSLKLFLNSFRSVGVLHEALPMLIGEALHKAISPQELLVVADYKPRGNFKTVTSYRTGKAVEQWTLDPELADTLRRAHSGD